MKQNKGKQAAQWELWKTCDHCGRQHPSPWRRLASPCFGCGGMGHKVANCPKATLNSQVILRDPEQESSQQHNEVALQLVFPQETVETVRNLKREVENSDWKEIPLKQYQVLLLLTIFMLVIQLISNATQSFINPRFAKKLASKPDVMDTQLFMSSL